MSLRGSETTEAISEAVEIQEIAALPSVARNDRKGLRNSLEGGNPVVLGILEVRSPPVADAACGARGQASRERPSIRLLADRYCSLVDQDGHPVDWQPGCLLPSVMRPLFSDPTITPALHYSNIPFSSPVSCLLSPAEAPTSDL